MAKSVVKLLTKTLQYPDGTPVACVIADSTIGRVAESAACTEKFRRENVAVTITVTPCWCYGSETMDMDPHTVKAIWRFNGTERPGAVYLAAPAFLLTWNPCMVLYLLIESFSVRAIT